MTNEELIAKIKELNLVTKTYEEQVAFNNALAMVVEIIETLEPEKPINTDELEEEIMRYTRNDYDRDTTVRDVARHFYKLGKNANK